jgi:putative heme-binding domain-containing protein
MKSNLSLPIACCVSAVLAISTVRTHLFAQAQPSANAAALFAANCAACHGSDGRSGERAPDIATRREVLSRSDADLLRVVQNGLPGTPMPAFGYLGRDRLVALVRQLRTLQGIGVAVAVPGDPRAGEAIFFGVAGCSECHMMQGRGGYRAGDLSGYGLGRTQNDVRAAIVDPDRKLDRFSQYVTVVTENGQKWVGFIRSEDNFSLVLQTDNGSYRQLDKDRITQVVYSGHSSMPQDYESRLSSKQLDDLVSYILKTASHERKAAQDDDD